MEQEEKLCDEVETVWKFTCLVDRVSVVGVCAAAVTARTRCGLVKFSEGDKLLYGRSFALKLKGAVYWSYVRLAILYGSEAWCLKESEVRILQGTERPVVRAICGVELKDGKRSMDLMFMLGLS